MNEIIHDKKIIVAGSYIVNNESRCGQAYSRHLHEDCRYQEGQSATHYFAPDYVVGSTQDAEIAGGTSCGDGVIWSHPSLGHIRSKPSLATSIAIF